MLHEQPCQCLVGTHSGFIKLTVDKNNIGNIIIYDNILFLEISNNKYNLYAFNMIYF